MSLLLSKIFYMYRGEYKAMLEIRNQRSLEDYNTDIYNLPIRFSEVTVTNLRLIIFSFCMEYLLASSF